MGRGGVVVVERGVGTDVGVGRIVAGWGLAVVVDVGDTTSTCKDGRVGLLL